MRRVVIESPFAAPRGHWPSVWYRYQNKRYARKCLRDCLLRGESPLASHLLYTQPDVLNDHLASERLQGMKAGWEWMTKADCVVVYTDRGISAGMLLGVKRARELNIPVEQRWLDKPKAGEHIPD